MSGELRGRVDVYCDDELPLRFEQRPQPATSRHGAAAMVCAVVFGSGAMCGVIAVLIAQWVAL